MRLIHTADWHLGQTFYEYDRGWEHDRFLQWLLDTIKAESADALLIAGDIFDVSNPDAASVTRFYTFLREAVVANPNLYIFVIAGNHDSPSRLEAPKPLLEAFNIHIVGSLPLTPQGEPDFARLVLPVLDAEHNILGYVMAVPFIRNGDFLSSGEQRFSYTEGICEIYKQTLHYALQMRDPNKPIVAMGHLHTSGATMSEGDKSEREVMGGAEHVPASAFGPEIAYTALGHIHRPQQAGTEYIRYAGSPIPMSFSEVHYPHQVVFIQTDGRSVKEIRSVKAPVTVPLLRIPAAHSPLDAAIEMLRELPLAVKDEAHSAPYLEVRVRLDGPEPGLRFRIESAVADRHVRLARIDARYPDGKDENETVSPDILNTLQPADVFKKVYQSKFHIDPPVALSDFFTEVLHDISEGTTL